MLKEVYGDLFAFYKRPGYKICITTNGYVKKNGEGVMGAGCAKEAAAIEADLPRLLGQSLKTRRNVVANLTEQFISFPVKHNWFEDADPELIKTSALALKERASAQPSIKFMLPRPGCGNGGLKWEVVKPLLESLNLPENIIIVGFWEERPRP